MLSTYYGRVFFCNDKFYLTSGSSDYLYYSSDLSSWNKCSITADQFIYGMAYGNGIYVATGYVYNFYSSNGINWNMTSTASYTTMRYVAYGAGLFVALRENSGSGGGNGWFSFNGEDWGQTPLENMPFQSLVYGNGKFIAVPSKTASSGGSNTNIVKYTYDGISWLTSCDITLNDINGNDKLNEVMSRMRGISPESLQLAYKEGVNSYE